jgi:3-isopropylmalate/(R)-2-methylmalate dehydratase small subunit
LHKYLLENSGVELAIDIEAQTLSIKDYDKVHFEIEPFAKFCLLNGVDQLGFLQNEIDLIHDFESKHGK